MHEERRGADRGAGPVRRPHGEGGRATTGQKGILIRQKDLLSDRIKELKALAKKLHYKISIFENQLLEKEKQMLGEQSKN